MPSPIPSGPHGESATPAGLDAPNDLLHIAYFLHRKQGMNSGRLPMDEEDVDEICMVLPEVITLFYSTLDLKEPTSLRDFCATSIAIQEQERWKSDVIYWFASKGYELVAHTQNEAASYSDFYRGIETFSTYTANVDCDWAAFQVRNEIRDATPKPELRQRHMTFTPVNYKRKRSTVLTLDQDEVSSKSTRLSARQGRRYV
ncbi:hypothetical protein F53441_8433 [Fusarium austroafricanum]|uniref:Uncharacterized protein n=1 Tax=Fusarium austroafricanum TaxID=2364996 RepID=A0A8H4KBD4_9HYPO|nr:hypothetical protein F53441_8433 [Fusarium austroafricanum]